MNVSNNSNINQIVADSYENSNLSSTSFSNFQGSYQPLPSTGSKPKNGFFSNFNFGNIVDEIADFGVDLFKGTVDAVRGAGINIVESSKDFFSGAGNIFKGNLIQGAKDIGKSVLSLGVQTPFGIFATAIGNPLLSIGSTSSPLSDNEKLMAKEIFGDSINLDSVRIKKLPSNTSSVFSKFAAALVLGDDIFIPNEVHQKGYPDIHQDQQLLAHELTHVWQHQNGGINYISKALYAQHFGEGYEIIEALAKGKNFSELNPEQQAVVVEYLISSDNFRYGKKIVLSEQQRKDALYHLQRGLGAP